MDGGTAKWPCRILGRVALVVPTSSTRKCLKTGMFCQLYSALFCHLPFANFCQKLARRRKSMPNLQNFPLIGCFPQNTERSSFGTLLVWMLQHNGYVFGRLDSLYLVMDVPRKCLFWVSSGLYHFWFQTLTSFATYSEFSNRYWFVWHVIQQGSPGGNTIYCHTEAIGY